MTAAIDLQNAFCIYRSETGATAALQGLDLTVERGEIVVVLGPSGAGKSTLLRVLAGGERLSAGSARVFGIDLAGLDRPRATAFRATAIGQLDQHYARSLSPDLSCRQTVALQLELRGSPPGRARRVADELLARVGLADRAHERPERLSGGEQQRVAVCAAVAHRPGLLLADEPAGELDASNASAVYALLGELVREAGASALVVSHDLAAASIADRLVHLRDGRIVAQSRPGGDPALVVSRKGWVRLPHDLPGVGGELGFVRAVEAGREIVLHPVPAELVGGSPADARVPAAAPPVAPPPGAAVAELQNVEKRYSSGGDERTVLAQVDRTFRAGTLTGLVGRSGSGKTTLLHLLAGLDRPSGGEVILAGRSLGELSREELAALRRSDIALVTQEPGLIPYLSAVENVRLGLRLRTGSRSDDTRARAALVEVGLGERLGQRVADLSAGERERVAIARALAADVRLLLVDEPTARLDEENARAVGLLLARAAHERGLAVVCATHDPALIETMDETFTLGTTAV